MNTNQFLDRLYEHPATTALAEALSLVVSTRRASAARRAWAALQLAPVPIETRRRPRREANEALDPRLPEIVLSGF